MLYNVDKGYQLHKWKQVTNIVDAHFSNDLKIL